MLIHQCTDGRISHHVAASSEEELLVLQKRRHRVEIVSHVIILPLTSVGVALLVLYTLRQSPIIVIVVTSVGSFSFLTRSSRGRIHVVVLLHHCVLVLFGVFGILQQKSYLWWSRRPASTFPAGHGWLGCSAGWAVRLADRNSAG